MADTVENMMLEHLKHFQATLETLTGRIEELAVRQNETHAAVLGLRRDQVNDAEVVVQVQMDRMRSRLDRIERRLELTN